jgi:hypothetical protein
MAACADEVRDLVEELVALTGAEHTWGVRTLRRNTEIALRNPRTLERSENQMDFVEDLAEAVWAGTEPGYRYAVRPGPGGQDEAAAERLQAILDRLDQLAVALCAEVTAWRRVALAAAGEPPLHASRCPQASHWI